MRKAGGRAVRYHAQKPVPEPGHKRSERRQSGEQRRGQLTALALTADLAVFYVPVDPLAHQHGQPAVPARQQRAELVARFPAGPRDDQRAEGGFELGASPGHQRVRVVA